MNAMGSFSSSTLKSASDNIPPRGSVWHMTDRTSCLQLESWHARARRVTSVHQAHPGIAQGSSARNRIDSLKAGLAAEGRHR